MKSWIHEIAESYVAGHKPVRRDLKENYVSLNEEQRFGLLSENVLVYLDEQLQNAFGFGVSDLTEEELNTIFASLLPEQTASPEQTGSPEQAALPETPETKTVTVGGIRYSVQQGHVVGIPRNGGILIGPEAHVKAAVGEKKIRILDPWRSR